MIDRLDHLVLTVRDISDTLAFYTGILGMEEVTFEPGRKALRFGSQKINLHQAGSEFEPKAQRPRPGSADLCFITSVQVLKVADLVRGAGVVIIEGPVARIGAMGPIESIYFLDPDGNLIEVSNYAKET